MNRATPTSASTKYTAAIKVLYTTTIQAIAVAPGYASSVVATGLFNIKASDLTEVAVADPPATAVVGKSFSVADAVVNLGGATSPASVTQYYLSTTAAKGGYLLTGSRAVPALKAKDVSVGFTTVTVPAGTAAGVYYLVACADNTSAAAERRAARKLFVPVGNPGKPDDIGYVALFLCSDASDYVTGGDLVETAVSNPPSRVSPSLTFSVSDTVKNQGKGAAAASTTRYYLSTTASKTAKSILLSGTRSVPALAAGAASTSTVNVKTPSALASGIYYLVACADDLSAISETIESNNCKVSAAITTR